MTNPRLQEIEQEILELAESDAELYSVTLEANSHFNNFDLGN